MGRLRVEVESEGPDRLLVRWVGADDGDVELAVGEEPNAASHLAVARVPAAAGSARLEGLGVRRHYVSVRHSDSTIVVAERRVPFAGLMNFRDLGGYSSTLGGTTRWGRVFRSDSPHGLTVEDLPVFDALGVETIYDLRRLDEREESPGPRTSVHHLLPSRRVADADLETLKDRADGERWLLEDYLGMLDDGAPVFGQLFSALASAAGPAVIHCYGGKDRTGMSSALLLSALGVRRDDVLDDYELTSSYHTDETIETIVVVFADSNIPRDAALGMLSTPRWVMATVLDTLDRDRGGIEAYLRGPGAMEGEALSALRARLLE